MDNVDIAIIGAGIAGLSTAVACARAGISAHVYEAAPQFRALGTSLSLWPNAMACLADWGLENAVLQAGSRISDLTWRTPEDDPYFVQTLEPLYSKFGHSGVCVKRADLHHFLVSAVPEECLHPAQELVSLQHEDGGTQLEFASGAKVFARHVIGADGVWSKTRSLTLNDGPPDYAGYGAWLGHSNATLPRMADGAGCEFIGKSARLGVFQTGDNQRYWFLVTNNPTPTRKAQVAQVSDALAAMSDWPDDLRALVSGTPENDVVYVSFHDRPVGANWGVGAVTLIGDALHPMVPNLGQGACQAIEDGRTMAALLAQDLRGPALTQAFKSARKDRLSYMYKTARRTGRLAQSEHFAARSMMRLLGFEPFASMMRADFRRQFQPT